MVTCLKSMDLEVWDMRNTYAKYEHPIFYDKKVMANVQKKVTSHGLGHKFKNLWYRWKGLVIRNTYAKYKNPIFEDKKIIANVKVFQKKVKDHIQGHMFKIYSAVGKEYTCQIWKPYQVG